MLERAVSHNAPRQQLYQASVYASPGTQVCALTGRHDSSEAVAACHCRLSYAQALALGTKGVGHLLNGKLSPFSVEAQKGAHSLEAGTMAAAGNRDELLASFAAVTGSNEGEMYLQACQLQDRFVPLS